MIELILLIQRKHILKLHFVNGFLK